MRSGYIQSISLLIVCLGSGLIVFIYSSQPRDLSEIGTKSAVALGTYQIDKQAFAQGLDEFRRDEFAAARRSFDRADPEKRDPGVQFYYAYSYYRQGWGRVSNDDDLFTKGLEAARHASQLDPSYKADDPDLAIKTPAALERELEEGLKISLSDFNPLKLTRERK